MRALGFECSYCTGVCNKKARLEEERWQKVVGGKARGDQYSQIELCEYLSLCFTAMYFSSMHKYIKYMKTRYV